jgi:hypothetical protein
MELQMERGEMKMKLTKRHARKVLEVVDVGLVHGLGKPEPGKMCVEAAICYALDLPHSDKPGCVAECIRQYKIKVNDSSWSSDTARAKGMRRAAIAQLGSSDIDQGKWVKIVAEQTIRQIVPIPLRFVAEKYAKRIGTENAARLVEAALRCENEGSKAAAYDAADAADAAYAANAYYDAAYAADDAADAAANAAAAAADAAYAANDAAAAAYAANAADDAADAAYAANDAADAAAKRDEILSIAAEICVQACVECKTQGSKWLDLAPLKKC